VLIIGIGYSFGWILFAPHILFRSGPAMLGFLSLLSCIIFAASNGLGAAACREDQDKIVAGESYGCPTCCCGCYECCSGCTVKVFFWIALIVASGGTIGWIQGSVHLIWNTGMVLIALFSVVSCLCYAGVTGLGATGCREEKKKGENQNCCGVCCKTCYQIEGTSLKVMAWLAFITACIFSMIWVSNSIGVLFHGGGLVMIGFLSVLSCLWFSGATSLCIAACSEEKEYLDGTADKAETGDAPAVVVTQVVAAGDVELVEDDFDPSEDVVVTEDAVSSTKRGLEL